MSESLATVAMYRSATDAAIAKERLERAGIAASSGAGIVQVNWLRWTRGFRLRVPREDFFRAADLLDAECRGLDEILEADEPIRDPEACPKCQSPDVAPRERLRTFAGIALLTFAVGMSIDQPQATFFAIAATAIYFVVSGRWRCGACGHAWS